MPPIPEGVYNAATRGAIIAWQIARGRPVTGFLGDSDATALYQENRSAVSDAPIVLAPPSLPFPRSAEPNETVQQTVLKEWINCLLEAADVLASQPESARTVAEAAYGSCGKEEAAFGEANAGVLTPAGIEKLKIDALTPKLLARVIAIRAAIAKLKGERGKKRSVEPSPTIEYNRM